MKNEEILKENNWNKFDIVLMNPPYGMRTDTIHLKFVDKCLNICNKQVVVMPFKFITKESKIYDKYKKSWKSYLHTVEEVDSKLFEDTAMENVAIYLFEKQNENIKINTINGNEYIINDLFNYKASINSDIDNDILKYLYNDHIKENVVWGGGLGKYNTTSLEKQGITDKDQIYEIQKKAIEDSSNNINKLKDKHTYLLLSHVTGNVFFSKTAGVICKNIDEIIDHALKYKFGKGFEIMGFESIKQAENCKEAMQHPLLRFGLIKAHPGLDITPRKSYRYVPDIDWTDDRVKTDEGLLEVCGCPKDKCKEYANYCKKIIDKVDKK